ncbi:ABC transporter permease [Actinosynnema pretiosum subsp. pretiosum]|uniref:Binding-protein-dependent transport systems inner membrane component n=2 Tax=Actinosynnema TaxID=40566 RepID=C6WGS8_ACTMD|nr:ABC transporter permease [Actinosynnema mirum]ACU35996.1 binding-protein-dependent transport systems inner membrane component [Actinosynnema mirum DSM 43827]QUF06307.1 ABC transporter permease [Actinosynnema pretiosum subsp. pretiosum]
MTATAVNGPGPAATRSRADGLRLLVQPAATLLLVGGVLLWAFSLDLDSIEQQSINASSLLTATWDHLVISLVVTALVVAIAVPLGVLVTRRWARRAAPLVLGLATIGQAAPAIGVLVLYFMATGAEGMWAAVVPITFYSLLPVLRNTVVGLQGVDPALVDAARGIGMSPLTVLRRVELPLAVPLILAGLRTALVLAVGVATLAVFVNGGGLGLLIDTGYKLARVPVLVTGAVLAVGLALLVDWLGAVAETYLGPKGLR